MGVERRKIHDGNGVDVPKSGDTVTIEYTGYLYDANAAANEYKGKVFDSTKNRGAFETQIGVGKVIKGWDEGVPQMTLGERAVLTISRVAAGTSTKLSDYAYGDRGFYDLIPPKSTLIFDVELKGINGKRA